MGLFDNIKVLVGSTPQTAQPQPSSPASVSKKILIVEDDQYLRDFYRELLQGEGYTMITAENGQLGLEAVQTQKPDLVLLDLMMPIMDGKTMLHQIRSIPEFQSLPVIILTNAGSVDNMRDTQFYDKANGFLIKSNTNPEEIIMSIKSLI